MKAIQAKGDANAVLSTLGLRQDELAPVLDSKIIAVKRVLAENTAEGKFPILGYSYLQYANSLKEQDPVNALFYLEYALEMSDLSIYFPEEKNFLENFPQQFSLDRTWLEGFVIGVILAILLMQLKPKKIKKYLKRLVR